MDTALPFGAAHLVAAGSHGRRQKQHCCHNKHDRDESVKHVYRPPRIRTDALDGIMVCGC